jgi:hypothetical protein
MTIATIITYYKGNLDYLNKLIKSIEKSLKNTKKNIIHYSIIIDDSSDDFISKILSDFVLNNFSESISKIIIIRNEENIGVTKSRLKGLEYIKNLNPDYFNIIDQDDFISNDFFERSMNLIRNHDILLFNGLYCYDNRISSDPIINSIRINKNFILSKKLIYVGNFIKTPGLLILKKRTLNTLIELYKLLSREIDGVDDYMMNIFLLLENNFKFRYENVNIFYYREHSSNQSLFVNFDSRVFLGLELLKNNKFINKKLYNKIFKKYKMKQFLRSQKGKNKYLTLFKFPVISIKFLIFKKL